MAIYVNLEDMDMELKDTAKDLEDYYDADADSPFVNGYNTAWDVATCANSATIWHKCDENNMPEGRVLIAQMVNRSIITAWWAMGSWHTDGYGVIDADAVVGWAELPDWPEGIND